MPSSNAETRLLRLTRVGGVLVVLGLLATLVLVGFGWRTDDLGPESLGAWSMLLAGLAPAGFVLVLVGLLGSARARRRS